ncbi:MAG: BREX-1 system adenine-specific DNA-methyltransferase PglX [Bacteroidota bacterium]|nr:BREX-1 system adenine-specific DNA-methyltransferase PglX [Bacteroidota bacterium]
MSVFIKQSITNQSTFKADAGWVILSPIEAAIKKKIESVGLPLKDWDIKIYRGILTGYNDAFIIDQKTKDELISKSGSTDLSGIIRPIIRGRAIEKYYNKLDNSHLIFTRRGIDIDEYIPIKEYLVNFYLDLVPKKNNEIRGRKPGTYKWFEIQDNIAYWREFEKPKIVWKRVGSVIRFSYDETGMYCLDSTCFATGNDLKFIVGYLNSTISKMELLRNSPQTGTGDVITSVQALEPHLIPKATIEQKDSIAMLVEQCINLLKSDELSNISIYEKQIDDIVFDIFGLTLEEREIVG